MGMSAEATGSNSERKAINFKPIKLTMLIALPALSITFFILSVFAKDIPLWSHLFRIVLSGFVGIFTNTIAIKMLFHPKQPLPLSKYQGLIHKDKPKLARELGENVSKELLSPEIIGKWVKQKGTIEKLGKLAVEESEKWLGNAKNRDRVKQVVTEFIQTLGTENLDPMVTKAIGWIEKIVQDEKTVLAALEATGNLVCWAVENEKFQEHIDNLVSYLSGATLKEDGVAAKLISGLIDQLQQQLENPAFQKKIADWAVTEVRNLSVDKQEALMDWGIQEIEKVFADTRKMRVIVDSLSRLINKIVSNDSVIEFVGEQLIILLSRNSSTLGHLINEGIKANVGPIRRALKSIFLPESKIVEILSHLSTEPKFKKEIHDYLQSFSFKVSREIKKKSTQRKFISYLQGNRKSIIVWCSTTGICKLVEYIEQLSESQGFWSFIKSVVSDAAPDIGMRLRLFLPSILQHLRNFIKKQQLERQLLTYLSTNSKELARKIATKENAEKLANLIAESKISVYDFLDTTLRPWLLNHSAKLLTSNAVWEWSEDAVERWIPVIAERVGKLVDNPSFKSKLEGYVPKIAADLQVDKIIEEQVILYSPDKLEQLVFKVSGDNLAGIEVFGGFLGIAAGTLTVVSECWYYAGAVFGLIALWIIAEQVSGYTKGRNAIGEVVKGLRKSRKNSDSEAKHSNEVLEQISSAPDKATDGLPIDSKDDFDEMKNQREGSADPELGNEISGIEERSDDPGQETEPLSSEDTAKPSPQTQEEAEASTAPPDNRNSSESKQMSPDPKEGDHSENQSTSSEQQNAKAVSIDSATASSESRSPDSKVIDAASPDNRKTVPGKTDISEQLQGEQTGFGRFIRYEDTEIVLDTETSLIWKVGPDRDTNWFKAKRWVLGLGDGWRMPTLDELEDLCRAGISSADWGPFWNLGLCVWAEELTQKTDKGKAFYYDFEDEEEGCDPRISDASTRAFAVHAGPAAASTDPTALKSNERSTENTLNANQVTEEIDDPEFQKDLEKVEKAIQNEIGYKSLCRKATKSFRALCVERAENGDASSQEILGKLISRNVGVDGLSNSKELAYRKQAASSGDLKSQLNLGDHYFDNGDYENAKKWFRLAADQGSVDGQFNLANSLLQLDINSEEAGEFMKLAARQNDCYAQYMLGDSYLVGHLGLEKSIEKAVEWFRIAAANGEKESSKEIIRLLKNNRIPSYDYSEEVIRIKEEIEWEENLDSIDDLLMPHVVDMFKNLTEDGDKLSQEVLGRLLSRDKLVDEIDYERMVSFVKKAAEAGDVKSQLRMGEICRSNGLVEEASDWESMAKVKGGE